MSNCICDEGKCTGCGLCTFICQSNAVVKKNNKTGHIIYLIDDKKCVDCGACKRICPNNQELEFKEPLVTYAAWSKNNEIRSKSSSGGIAATFYEVAINKGYYIVGAYLNSNYDLKLKLSNETSDIEKFQSSKYIQADTDNIYRKCIDKLKSGNSILFIGTPCQCAAMRSISQNFRKQVLIVELVCHGTPSQYLFREYLKIITKDKKIDKISFRDNDGVCLSIMKDNKYIWKKTPLFDNYLYCFQNGIISNECCYSCNYAKGKRIADITIGDFWGIGRNVPFNYPKEKVSLILINTDIGKEFFEYAKRDLILVKREYNEARERNPQLNGPIEKSEKYNIFWESYEKNSLINALKKTIPYKVKIRRVKFIIKMKIKSIIKSIIH